MKPWHALVVAVGISWPGLAAAEVLPLHRGVGLNEWLNWSPLDPDGTYHWPPYRSVEDWLGRYRPLSHWPGGDPFERIKALGFDFVRLTVDPGPLLATSGDRRQEAIGIIASDVRRVTAAGLKVVVNLHDNNQVPAYGSDLVDAGAATPGIATHRAVTAELAAALVSIDVHKVAIEPFNEPAYYPCDETGDEDWQTIMSGHVAAIRAVSPDLTIIATGACGGDVDGLVDIVPSFDDPAISYSFHMYEPHLFTHQRSPDATVYASGLPWPAASRTPDAVVAALSARMDAAGADAAEKAATLRAMHPTIEQYFAEDWGPAQLETRIDQAVAWANAHGIPSARLFMGEFGVIAMSPDGKMGAADPDRLRYLAAVRSAAEARSIPWGIWEYSNPWGMTVIAADGPAIPDLPLLEALGLR